MKLQTDDGPRYSLGIGSSSDDAVGSRRKFTRRFVEGIGKLAGNAKGDRREIIGKKTRGLVIRLSEVTEVYGNYGRRPTADSR
ncbi:hypothetical protein B296_00041400 [Ensete ventricosum]|uniref:Uncharacterized protein n=1 Tax=Ensete ventricosum TaxID=4639 RepID=A0A426Y111_ENSVE|nr:hypothetical protein B296_00041400 [Ensete ventricosum]